jgi:multiple sugar transport system substrate-binding protein
MTINRLIPSGRPLATGRSRPRRRYLLGTATLAALSTVALAACGGSSGGSSSNAPLPGQTSATTTGGGSGCKSSDVKLTVWAWVPGFSRDAALYNKTHSGVCVTVQNIGAGSAEYVKIADALKAGTGAPDVAEIEYAELPSFEITKSLVNQAQYGAAKYQGDFAKWAWSDVTNGSDIWSMPMDAGPLAFYYNSKLMAKYGLKPPTTYAQMASEAATLKKKDPSAFFTSIDLTDIQTWVGLMAQDGAFPFAYKGGKNVTINFTGPKQMAWAKYWQNLIDAKEVNTPTGNTALEDRDKGIDAAWLAPAWGPSYFAPDVKQTEGDWRSAALPQWQAGANVQAVVACSTLATFTQSQHPQQAAEFAQWATTQPSSWKVLVTPPSSLFPTYLPEANATSFQDITVPESGTSHPNVAWAQAETGIQAQEWPPFLTAALTDSTTFSGVDNGTQTIAAALQKYQSQLVAYAKSEGFNVTQ